MSDKRPLEVIEALVRSGERDMARTVARMYVALCMTDDAIYGDGGLELLKPVSAEAANQIGQLCEAARHNNAHEELDKVTEASFREKFGDQ